MIKYSMKYPMLYEFIKQMADVPVSEWVALEEIAQIREFKKTQQYWLSDIAQNLYMVVTGAIECFISKIMAEEYLHV